MRPANSTGSPAPTRAYSMERRAKAVEARKQRIAHAVKAMLADGSFHDASMADVAQRAGVGRATVYEHFGSRTGLIDTVCASLEATLEMQALRAATTRPDPVDALEAVFLAATRFWAHEHAMFTQLTALAEIDEAARGWRDRMRADRGGVCAALTDRLDAAGELALPPRAARAHLLLASSFEAFAELRDHAGLTQKETETAIQTLAKAVLRTSKQGSGA